MQPSKLYESLATHFSETFRVFLPQHPGFGNAEVSHSVKTEVCRARRVQDRLCLNAIAIVVRIPRECIVLLPMRLR